MDATMCFKRGGRNYMIRSVKRPGLLGYSPKGKKPKSHWVYKLLTLLFLIICCPVGLVMLWRRRPIRWLGGTKLFLSLISLILCFALITVALLYDFETPWMKKTQNTLLYALNNTETFIKDLADSSVKNWQDVIDYAPEVAGVIGDQAVGLLQAAVSTPAPEATASAEPDVTAAPIISSVPDATETMMRPVPTGSLQPAVGSVTTFPNVTVDPAATPTPVPTPTPTPTPVPTPTPEPTVDPALIPPMRSVGEVLVWHTTDGKWYHLAAKCGSMTNARQYTLADSVKDGLTACPWCHPISESTLGIENAVFVSEDGYWHINFECESVLNGWTLESIETVWQNVTLRPCDACGAIYYKNGIPKYNAASIPQQPTDDHSGNADDETLVYTSDRNAYYHRMASCSGAAGVSLVPTHLKDAAAAGKKACTVCNPPQK